jgi:uncharacterized metal-binding protein
MVDVSTVTNTAPKVAEIIGSISGFVTGGITKVLTLGNIFFIVIIVGLIWGIFNLWKIDLQNTHYLSSRKREI